jgi:pyruvate dehydrogenase E1 component alpha subunit
MPLLPAGGRRSYVAGMETAESSGDIFQVLDIDGRVVAPEHFPDDVKDSDLLDWYRHMVVARRLDKVGMVLQRQGQLGLYASLLGQEAAQVGSAATLAPQDWIFGAYREMAAGVLRGLDPAGMMHVWRGTWHGWHDPRAQGFAPMALPIGTQTPHAVGFAMAAQFDGADLVVLCYIGDGATSTGDAHEGMNMAGVFQAPVVFLVQNNHYAISVPLSRQTRAPSLAARAVGYGFEGVRCDGNDVLACYVATREAVERARSGGGPGLVEALTYRLESHTTADDAARYRDPEEVAWWRARDPIARFEAFLEREGLLAADRRAAVSAAAAAAATKLREAVVDAPPPDIDDLFEMPYVDPPPSLLEQRAALERELERGR